MSMYLLSLALVAVGLYGLLAKRHLLKKVIGLILCEHGINLFLVCLGYRTGAHPPILLGPEDQASFVSASVDPVPQALVLTSIVIGLGVAMLMIAFVLRLHERYGSLDADDMSRLKG